MLALLVAALLPACPADVTAQPGRAAEPLKIVKPRVGRAPTAPCMDADGHLAIPPLPYEIERAILRPAGIAIVRQIAEWMRVNPSEGLKIYSTYPISWVRSARPALSRAQAVRTLLQRAGIAPARVTVHAQDILVRDRTPDAQAKRRAARHMWFQRVPVTPKGAAPCTNGAGCP